MYRDSISIRQISVILFSAALAPVVRALPTWTAKTAGVGAWLTGIFAFPVLLFIVWIITALLRAVPNKGLSEVFQTVLGPLAGKCLTIIYMVWALCRLMLETRLYGDRMVVASGKNASLPVLILILLGLTLWLGRKKLAAFARATEIFYLVLAVTLGTVLFFSVSTLAPENVLPIWVEDLPQIAMATVAPVGVVCFGVFAAFLHVTPREKDWKRGMGWLAVGCLTMTLLQLGILGQFGPALTAGMDTPFFEVARGVGVAGAFQRVESMVVALWLLSDLALLGLFIFALKAMVQSVFGAKWEKWTPLVAVVLTFFGAIFLLPDSFFANRLSVSVAFWGDVILCVAIPALVLLIQRGKNARIAHVNST